MCECVVCHDECVKIVRCANGHSCCMGCVLASSDSRCPVCREMRAPVAEAAMPVALEATGTLLRCHSCNTCTRAEDCERHRAWCPAHRFVCPWSTCTQCVRASDMAAHVRHHGEVHALTRKIDGTFHVVLTLTRAGDTFVMCVRDTTLVISNTLQRRMGGPDGLFMHIHLRAYYPGPDAPSLHATVRQLRVSDCDTHDGWTEAYRYGVVPPMIASRESVVLAWPSPVVTPRTCTGDAFDPFVLPDACPGLSSQLRDQVRKAGVRDVSNKAAADMQTPTALLHLVLREDPRVPIVRLFDS